MSAGLHLAILPATGNLRFFPLGNQPITVGSSPESTIVLADPELAPTHLRILPRDGGHVLTRESLPLLVNGLRAKAQVLKAYDLIVIGKNALAVRPGPIPAAVGAEDVGLVAIRRLRAFADRVRQREEPATLAQDLLAHVVELTGASRGAIVALAVEDDPARVVACTRGDFEDDEVAYSRTLVARMCEKGRSILVSSIEEDDELANAPSLLGSSAQTAVVVPIRVEERITGALYISSPSPHALAGSSLELLELFATQAAHLLAHEERTAALETHLADLGDAFTDESAIVGSAPSIHTLRKTLGRVSTANAPILIVGETGTGKELVAREIHRLSTRARGPFVAVNCGAISHELLASELFGHVRGAFTHAQRDRVGFFRSAEGGTLFLDELFEMPGAQQVALLRALQEHHVTPVGSDVSVPIDVRIVSATNRVPEVEVASGRFRQDLYFRVAVVTVPLPPLRERGADILQLAQHFLRKHAKEHGAVGLRFSDDALTAMRRAAWQGNVRELDAAVRRAVLMHEGDAVSATELGLVGQPAGADVVRPLAMARDEFLREYVKGVVQRFDGNRTAAADALLVSPRTVFKYLEE